MRYSAVSANGRYGFGAAPSSVIDDVEIQPASSPTGRKTYRSRTSGTTLGWKM
jgi:hypothetical protein